MGGRRCRRPFERRAREDSDGGGWAGNPDVASLPRTIPFMPESPKSRQPEQSAGDCLLSFSLAIRLRLWVRGCEQERARTRDAPHFEQIREKLVRLDVCRISSFESGA